MEDIPPSYDEINANVLDLLPPYLSTASLVNLCLVSKAYYDTFIPHLWGSPASHFVELADETSRTTNGINFSNLQVTGSQNDLVYVALTRFKRALRKARLSTRLLCHTLHLPPALGELYSGPASGWIAEVLERLPSLQSLCVSGLPFFDHDSLVAVDQVKGSSAPNNPNAADFRRYPLKLLLAAKEPNVTWVGLSLLIPHLPNLIYLDLSYTPPARNANVLQSLDALSHLQILKLRGVGLKDNELEVLANVIGLRVRLLDIAENQLSDRAVRSLLQACVWLPSTNPDAATSPYPTYSRRHLESWPVGLPPPPDSQSLDTIRTIELDEALLKQLTHPLTGRLAFEDIPHGGITHLFLSGNPGITIESIRSILDLGRLHVLDAANIGALTAVDLQVLAALQIPGSTRDVTRARSISMNSKTVRGFINRHRSRPSSVHSLESGPSAEESLLAAVEDDLLRMPGAEKLVPVLREKAADNLTHLRIDHKVATSVLDISKELKEKDKAISNYVELPGEISRAVEMDSATREVYEAPASKSFPSEMPADNAIFEMDATPAAPRAELPGDIIHFAVSPPIGDVPQSAIEDITAPIRGEGAMAPEVVEPVEPQTPDRTHVVENEEEKIILGANGSGIKRTGTVSTESTISTLLSSVSLTSSNGSVHRPAPLRFKRTAQGISGPQSQSPMAQKEIVALLSLRPKGPATKLHPSFLPNLRTLILTNLPCRVSADEAYVIENLKAFIAACAAESRLAILKAKTDYSLPPGKARQKAEREHAQKLFALRTIVLEVNPEMDASQQRGWKHTRQRIDISKSSTGDRDSEALWSAAENDFSFFGEEGEEAAECGIYDQEPDKYYPTVTFDDKIVVTATDRQSGWDSPDSVSSPRISSPSLYGPNNSTLRAPNSPAGTTFLQSPRNLPLGRNRRVSNDMNRTQSPVASDLRLPSRSGQTYFSEMPGSIPSPRQRPPTSTPAPPQTEQEPPQKPPLDVVAELAAWRRERKAAYEAKTAERVRRSSSGSVLSGRLAEAEIYVDGYWAGEVKVVRNATKKATTGKMERQGNVDVYGNYFEGNYLYP